MWRRNKVVSALLSVFCEKRRSGESQSAQVIQSGMRKCLGRNYAGGSCPKSHISVSYPETLGTTLYAIDNIDIGELVRNIILHILSLSSHLGWFLLSIDLSYNFSRQCLCRHKVLNDPLGNIIIAMSCKSPFRRRVLRPFTYGPAGQHWYDLSSLIVLY